MSPFAQEIVSAVHFLRDATEDKDNPCAVVVVAGGNLIAMHGQSTDIIAALKKVSEDNPAFSRQPERVSFFISVPNNQAANPIDSELLQAMSAFGQWCKVTADKFLVLLVGDDKSVVAALLSKLLPSN